MCARITLIHSACVYCTGRDYYGPTAYPIEKTSSYIEVIDINIIQSLNPEISTGDLVVREPQISNDMQWDPDEWWRLPQNHVISDASSSYDHDIFRLVT